MKTDRFSDSIRRKLESIRPEFTENDWTRMQSALQQATPPHPGPSATGGGSVWTGHPWLLAAASISTAVLVAVSVWQWREISSLRQTIGQLTQQPPSVQTRPAQDQQKSTTSAKAETAQLPTNTQKPGLPEQLPVATYPQHDTVYITRQVVTPPSPQPEITRKQVDNHPESLPEQPPVAATDNPVMANTTHPKTEVTINENPASPGNFSTLKNSTHAVPTGSTSPRNESLTERNNGKLTPASTARNADLNVASSPDTPTNKSRANVDVQIVQPDEVNSIPAAYQQLASRPLSIEQKNWQAALTKRASRIYVVQPSQPVATPVEQTAIVQSASPMGPRFRLGAGAEVASHLWRTDVYADVLFGKHWMLSLGFGKAVYTGAFIDDFDFDSRTRRDFRREFAHTLDPKIEILNIGIGTTRIQIPLSVTYRVPLSQSLTLIPSVGTNINLSSTENVSFYTPVLLPKRSFKNFDISAPRTVELVNSFTFGAGLEWQRRHWVVQGGPVVVVPSKDAPGALNPIPNWQKATTVGLRARLLYQF